MEKEPAKTLRLTDKHSTMQKVQKLWDLADKLGLYIEFFGHRTIVTDAETPDIYYDMCDLEDSDRAVSGFPPGVEFKLIRENPAYTEFWEKRDAEYNKQLTAERQARMQAEAEEKRRKEEEARRIKEEQERKLLAELKAKYDATEGSN